MELIKFISGDSLDEINEQIGEINISGGTIKQMLEMKYRYNWKNVQLIVLVSYDNIKQYKAERKKEEIVK